MQNQCGLPIPISFFYSQLLSASSPGRNAAVKALQNNPNPTTLQLEPQIIGELIDIVLQNNVFEFNESFYLQKQGTAMGTKMAPSYANLFMGDLELQLLELGKPRIHMWKRFIDDIFLIWTGSQQQLDEFMGKINSHHRTIKFTHETSENEATFLDVTAYKGEKFQTTGILDVKTHIKPTNKQLYVYASSYHPPATKLDIAKDEAKRYLRTNSTKQHFDGMLKKLTAKLIQRG